MTLENAPDAILSVFVVFCRVGACLMAMPGFSSPRVMVRVRLFIAIAATLAISPLILVVVEPIIAAAPLDELLRIIFVELLIGVLIATFGRAFFGMLQMMVGAAANASSFSMPMSVVEEYQQLPPMAGLVTLTATTLLFISGAHADVFVALAQSYHAVPVGGDFVPGAALDQFSTKLMQGMVLALRITSPFLLYGLIVNLTLGLTNRLMPQMAVYFVAIPAVMMGGLFILWQVVSELLRLFYAGLGDWLVLQ
ncbi:flagellar biosynthetic protein FliR [Pseudovibrio sp. Tun.PSC04-5.I4]|uniref:flagellar biosynthetic protein FliR n=1 Tax=Pseudovibrio sp. Tun.PSC04-5.I4 TaxID=1798213 RepID=UPI0008895F12|nr:flagellar biosynthetic protein FliR [Pseudovibrio sp. Tun.PSC04-5.I4]SDQ93100.1 flagellar biosynthetic protein FliR [Pseudovibrio sp. Tun.PSC04-5.I4]